MKSLFTLLGLGLGVSASIVANSNAKCCFHLKSFGSLAGPLWETIDGTIQAGADVKPSTFCVDPSTGHIVDSAGRLCTIDDSDGQFGCRKSASDSPRFHDDGAMLRYQGEVNFWACPSPSNKHYNIHTKRPSTSSFCVPVALKPSENCLQRSSLELRDVDCSYYENCYKNLECTLPKTSAIPKKCWKPHFDYPRPLPVTSTLEGFSQGNVKRKDNLEDPSHESKTREPPYHSETELHHHSFTTLPRPYSTHSSYTHRTKAHLSSTLKPHPISPTKPEPHTAQSKIYVYDSSSQISHTKPTVPPETNLYERPSLSPLTVSLTSTKVSVSAFAPAPSNVTIPVQKRGGIDLSKPHSEIQPLIIQLMNSHQPNQVYPYSKYVRLCNGMSAVYTFVIPERFTGTPCELRFDFNPGVQLGAHRYSGEGELQVVKLAAAMDPGGSFDNMTPATHDVTTINLRDGNTFVVKREMCMPGKVSYHLKPVYHICLEYLQPEPMEYGGDRVGGLRYVLQTHLH